LCTEFQQLVLSAEHRIPRGTINPYHYANLLYGSNCGLVQILHIFEIAERNDQWKKSKK